MIIRLIQQLGSSTWKSSTLVTVSVTEYAITNEYYNVVLLIPLKQKTPYQKGSFVPIYLNLNLLRRISLLLELKRNTQDLVAVFPKFITFIDDRLILEFISKLLVELLHLRPDYKLTITLIRV